MVESYRNSINSLQDNVVKTRKSITHNTAGFATNNASRLSSVQDFDGKSAEVVRSLKRKVLKHELLEDIPTSETPKKRDYSIPSTWSLTKSHEEILGQMNKMPLGNVDINLTTQTPATMTRVQTATVEDVGLAENSFQKRLVTPAFEKGMVVEKVATSEGRENSVFKSKLSAPAKRRAMGSH